MLDEGAVALLVPSWEIGVSSGVSFYRHGELQVEIVGLLCA